MNEIFFDFLANYLVYEKIDKSIPEEHIELNCISFQTIFKTGYGIFGLLKACLLTSQIIYIYGQWDILKQVFGEFKVNSLLEYLYIINTIFKDIIVKNNDNKSINMDSTISDIKDLAKILDRINWKEIFLEKKTNTNDIDLLYFLKNKIIERNYG